MCHKKMSRNWSRYVSSHRKNDAFQKRDCLQWIAYFLFLKVTGKKARIGSFSHSGHALFFIDKAIDGIPVIKLQRIVLSPLENYCVVDET